MLELVSTEPSAVPPERFQAYKAGRLFEIEA